MWGLVVWQLFGLLTGVMGPAFLPPLAKEKGLSDNEAAVLLTLLGGLDIGSRLMPGVIAHYGLLKPHQMVILALVLQGALCQVRRRYAGSLRNTKLLFIRLEHDRVASVFKKKSKVFKYAK